MPACDTLIRNALVVDGSGGEPLLADVALADDRIRAVGSPLDYAADEVIDGAGYVLAPGFIDVHTHDDTNVVRTPEMLPKLSQGVTTVIVGNCGISAAPVRLVGDPPDPMNLLGDATVFRYPTFAAYVESIEAAHPAVNVTALVGHTALRNNHMDRLDRSATKSEIEAMRLQLIEALDCGAIGLSTGLAYLSANAATIDEVLALAEPLARAGGLYTTHLRSETEAIIDALSEAFTVGRECRVPVVVSHLKCAGVDNWGRSSEVLEELDAARASQAVGWDCYPYAAGSSTLDLRQVDERVDIRITWSEPHPEMGGRALAQIAQDWGMGQKEAARRLQPAGAIYHSIFEEDMRRILRHPATMIGSDGLPNDPLPHPRLWGTFPRVLGKYCRDEKLLSLAQAVHKMTGLPAARFGFADRGLVRASYFADLVLFDPRTIRDTATFDNPACRAEGIERVWVNGVLSYRNGMPTGQRGGKFIKRSAAITNKAFDSLQLEEHG